MRDVSQLSLHRVIHHLFLASLLASSVGLAAAQKCSGMATLIQRNYEKHSLCWFMGDLMYNEML